MEPYNFWQDFFSTYRSSSDIIKTLWLIVPPTFVVALTWVVLNAPLIRLQTRALKSLRRPSSGYRHLLPARGEKEAASPPQINLQR